MLTWIENGRPKCGYNNVVAATPFGEILITWKGWKDYPTCVVDEPVWLGVECFSFLDDAKEYCETELKRRCEDVLKPDPVTLAIKSPNTAKIYPDGTKIEMTQAMLDAGMCCLDFVDDVRGVDPFMLVVDVFTAMIRACVEAGGVYAPPEPD